MFYRKVYVSVIVKINNEGKLKPLEIEWSDGRRFKIDRILDERQAPSTVGSILTKKYKILVQGSEKSLYVETTTNRWFVETVSGY